MAGKPKVVREPIQVYLDSRDRSLLDTLAKRTAVPRSDVLRLALRRLSTELLGDERPGTSLASLVGVMDLARDIPPDLAARHDEYLYPAPLAAKRVRKRPQATAPAPKAKKAR